MPNKQTILFIDDDPAIRKMIGNFFLDHNFNVLLAEDGEQGLSLFHSHLPDIILVDLKMPRVDGFQVLNTIVQEKPDTPVIVISGEGEKADVIQALRLGAWNYYSKPIDNYKIILHTVEQALEKSRLQKENKAYQRGLEAKLQTIIENFDGFIFTCDPNCRITYMNPALENYVGHEMFGKHCRDIFFDSQDTCQWCNNTSPSAEKPEKYDFYNPKDDCWYEVVTINIANQKGHLEQRQIILQDITERKQALLALEEREEHLRKENTRLRATISGHYKFGNIIGKSPAMQGVYQAIINASASDASVIIYGESGTGKELVAKSIHQLSDRKDQKMVYVNCGAIPEHLIESEFFGYKKGAFTGATKDKEGFLGTADHGTLFLDEVGEIPLSMQIKLLRAIEGGGFSPLGNTEVKKPDIRIIAATNRDLKKMVQKGNMRRDFLYRIHIIPIHLPPLRDRKEDLRLLMEHFLDQYDKEKIPPLSSAIRKALYAYDWPGNVRELQNTINRFVTLKKLDFLGLESADDIADNKIEAMEINTDNMPLNDILHQVEKQVLFNSLQKHQWHKGNTAGALKIDPKTLYRKMKQYGLDGK